MSQPFTPLVAGSPALASEPKPSSTFTSLGHSHGSSKDTTDNKSGVDAAPGSVSGAGMPSDAARVILKREGDRITHVTIHCTCGQVLHLACSY
jgi:hypothetical protein